LLASFEVFANVFNTPGCQKIIKALSSCFLQSTYHVRIGIQYSLA